MTEFKIVIEEKTPKKQVTMTIDNELFFSGNFSIRNEQVLDTLTRFFIQCIRDDINIQEDLKLKDAGIWKERC